MSLENGYVEGCCLTIFSYEVCGDMAAQWFADFNWRVGVLVCQLVCMLTDCLARTEHPMSMTDTAGIE